MNNLYDASSIEVLSGLDPVRKRPGMYTDTSRPNHMAQEVIDNGVDEALAGYATFIDVTLHEDNSLEISDNGRGMPVDIHPDQKKTGVEVIFCQLHAGAKFSNKNYTFSGGLHGVGVSVVNALSTRLEVRIKRDGNEHYMHFENGNKASELEIVGRVGKQNRGTTIRFWPDESYFDSPRFSMARLKYNLKAKAVLCPGLRIRLTNLQNKEQEEWLFEDGLKDYLTQALADKPTVPDVPFTGKTKTASEQAEWAVMWQAEGGSGLEESYVNLIPTLQGGTHVNGFRAGLTEAVREFCEFRNLIPRGVKLTPDDIWEGINFILSVKIHDPQFSGQTKERLSSRECAAFVSGVVKDAFSLWLNHHTDAGEMIAEMVLQNAQKRMRSAQKVQRKRVVSGPALPGKLTDCSGQDPAASELFLVEGDSAGGSAKQARNREFQAVLPLRGKIKNTWESPSDQILKSEEIHNIAVAIGVDPGSDDLSKLRYNKICILADADSDGLHIATLLCALFLRHFPALVRGGHVYQAMPPLFRIDVGKQIFYALDEEERQALLHRIEKNKLRGKVQVTRFKGLGEMNPLQLRESTMSPETRRLLQLTLDEPTETHELMDMLLAQKRASERKSWLERKGHLADNDI